MNVLSNFLNSIDSVAKENLETDIKQSATDIRKNRRLLSETDISSSAISSSTTGIITTEITTNKNENDFIEDSNVINGDDSLVNENKSKLIDEDSINDTPAKSDIIKNVNDTINKTNIKSINTYHTPGPINLSTTKSQKKISSDTLIVNGIEELKKSLKDKDLEIEKLNAECLELEDQCSSLTKEAKEAWESYRISQERAAAREAELLDEVKEIQKAKAAEKQQIVAQITKSQNEIENLIKQIDILQV
jgi:hypothetical protein